MVGNKKHDETLFQIGEVTKITGTTRKTVSFHFLEGPPNRGKSSDDYITQIAVPIKE